MFTVLCFERLENRTTLRHWYVVVSLLSENLLIVEGSHPALRRPDGLACQGTDASDFATLGPGIWIWPRIC